MTMAKHNVYREGKIHVCESMCKTCIFRPGNLMKLEPGRVEGMVADSLAKQSVIICHSTLDGDNAVCAGFAKKHRTLPLALAELTGNIEYVEPGSLK